MITVEIIFIDYDDESGSVVSSNRVFIAEKLNTKAELEKYRKQLVSTHKYRGERVQIRFQYKTLEEKS